MKKEYLHKQIVLLKKCQLELIRTEFHNIKELKLKETVPLLNLTAVRFFYSSEALGFDFNLAASLAEGFSDRMHAASENNE